MSLFESPHSFARQSGCNVTLPDMMDDSMPPPAPRPPQRIPRRLRQERFELGEEHSDCFRRRSASRVDALLLPQWDGEGSDEECEGRRAMHSWWARLTAEKEKAAAHGGFPSVLDLDQFSDSESETRSNISDDRSPRCKDTDDGANFLACCIRR